MVDELKRSIERFEKKLAENEGEEYNVNGISTKAALNVTLFEAKDLPTNWIGSLDSYAVLSFENQTNQSKLQIGNNAPAWNEDFTFDVDSPSSLLKITIYSKQTLGLTKSEIGYVELELQSLLNQQKIDKWYNIIIGNKSNGNGQLRLRVQFIHSRRKYFSELIQSTMQKINLLEQKRNILKDYIEYINEPFGVIQLGSINENLKNIIYNEDEIIKEIESNRKSVYAFRASYIENPTFAGTLNNIIRGNISKFLCIIFL